MVGVRFTYFMPTKILFSPGSLEKLHSEQLPGKKALLVISAGGSMVRHGYLHRLVNILSSKDRLRGLRQDSPQPDQKTCHGGCSSGQKRAV